MSNYYPAVSSLLDVSAVPVHLRKIVADAFDRYGQPTRVARMEPNRPWVLVMPHHVVYLGPDERSNILVAQEAERLRWAASQSIPVPDVVEVGTRHFVVTRAARDEPRGEVYVAAAIAAADLIAAAEPPQLPPGSGERRSPRSTIPKRALRMAAAFIDPREFLSTRNRAAALEKDTLSHGDFHPNNVLFDRSKGTVAVIDWAHLGYQPRHTDLLYLWARFEDRRDRDAVLHAVLERANDVRSVATLHHWLAVRTLVEIANDRPILFGDRDAIREYRSVLSEARANAARLGDTKV